MKRLTFLGIFGCFCLFSLAVLASVPNLINYQGRLTDAAGNPITATTIVRFSLYQGGDATTPGSGTLVYEEDASVTPDSNGLFDHTIGTGTVVSGSLDATVFQTSSPIYLEITVDPAGVSDTLLPRKQVVSVGYSFKSERADDADKVDGQHASAFALVGHHHDADYVNEGQADSVTSSMIVDGTIVDADINAAANIAAAKINTSGLNADLLDGNDSLDFVHTTGDDMTGTLDVNTSSTYALIGESSSTTGRGVHGLATATIGPTYGVLGESNSTSGYGVYGFASATTGITYGIRGASNSTSGRGVFGLASATSGNNYGMYGQSSSTSGRGVYGYASASSGSAYGVWGRSNSTNGYGVYGQAAATSGTNYGVYGASGSTDGYGVYGSAPAYGVFGEATATSGFSHGVSGSSNSTTGRGVYGEAPYVGVYGVATASSGYNYGVYGKSDSTDGHAVHGYASATSGYNRGVYGISNSTSGMGIYGWASATSGTNYGVFGRTESPVGWAGYFVGDVKITGTIYSSSIISPTKSSVQEIDGGKKVTIYVMESPENWFEDFGTGKLVNGRAVVQIERLFAQTVNTGIGYYVFLTSNGNCQGLYISRQDKDSFEVRELGGGTSNISFYYRIVAKRRGYEGVRFEEFTEPEASPEVPNLPIETKAAKVKQPQRQ